jgi:tyrosyl-tRNA synthetase
MLAPIELLRRRGLLEQISDEAGLAALFAREQVSFYVGFDPTARSLHVGNFVPIMMMAHLQRAGHRPIAVVGGATGMIGDPSGRSSERNLLDDSAVLANLASIRTQLASFLRFEGATRPRWSTTPTGPAPSPTSTGCGMWASTSRSMR